MKESDTIRTYQNHSEPKSRAFWDYHFVQVLGTVQFGLHHTARSAYPPIGLQAGIWNLSLIFSTVLISIGRASNTVLNESVQRMMGLVDYDYNLVKKWDNNIYQNIL
jgi:hypothetical protein